MTLGRSVVTADFTLVRALPRVSPDMFFEANLRRGFSGAMVAIEEQPAFFPVRFLVRAQYPFVHGAEIAFAAWIFPLARMVVPDMLTEPAARPGAVVAIFTPVRLLVSVSPLVFLQRPGGRRSGTMITIELSV